MSDDDTLERLFSDGDVSDDGFTRVVMLRINRLRTRRRMVLGGAAAVGAAIAVPELWQALPAATSWAYLLGASVFNVTALCVGAAALWIFSVSVDA